MPSLTQQASGQGSVMIVDDNPANLKLLEGMLRQHGYEVRSFPRGRLAIAGAENDPPDVILLDINMPEMNGYEVCEHLKSRSSLSGIPVIFLSALSATEDKVKGFRVGAVDYISKPFQFEEVEARVETHLKLRRAQQAEHDLLERTLGGAVGTLWELLQLTSPVLAVRSRAVRDIVCCIVKGMGIKDPWQYELAGTLCLMGCIELPDDVFEKGYYGQTLTPDEDRMFLGHPASGANLLSKIPRLEIVADIIRGQHKPSSVQEPASLGARVLNLALELDRRVYRGGICSSVVADLRLTGRFDGRMLDALASYAPIRAEYQMRRLYVRDLRSGMVLENDVVSADGNLVIFKEGTVLTETWIQRLANFARSRGVSEPLDVRVPAPAG